MSDAGAGPAEPSVSYSVKWGGAVHEVALPLSATVLGLKRALEASTSVPVSRQKLLGLKVSGGGAADDETVMSEAVFKSLMMMGQAETAVKAVDDANADAPDLMDDLEVPEEECLAIMHRPENLAKLQARIAKVTLPVLNAARPGKKLLVLDIDYTLFDHRSPAEHPLELRRPFLLQFLTAAYEYYDIIIWSATSMRWITLKMKELQVIDAAAPFKIMSCVDATAMISVETQEGITDVKPLGWIWAKFPEYTARNTIMFDDLRRNFLMNPQNGLRIKAFSHAHRNQGDTELLKLGRYLAAIAHLDDFSVLEHRHWEAYTDKAERRAARRG